MTRDTTVVLGAIATAFLIQAGLTLGVYDRLSARIDELDNRLSARIEELGNRLSARIDELDDKLDANLRDIHGRLVRLEAIEGLPGEDLAVVTRVIEDQTEALPA